MNSSVPKPPQRIRVEMPAEVAPQPVPEAVLESVAEAIAPPNQPTAPSKIHISHPGLAAPPPPPPAAPTVPAAPEPSGMVTVPPDEVLFTRPYYPAAEVAAMFGTGQDQVSNWVNDFEVLQPQTTDNNEVHFRPEDVKNLVLIHYLLHQRRFTTNEAREYMQRHSSKVADAQAAVQALEKVKGFLLEMKADLGTPAPPALTVDEPLLLTTGRH